MQKATNSTNTTQYAQYSHRHTFVSFVHIYGTTRYVCAGISSFFPSFSDFVFFSSFLLLSLAVSVDSIFQHTALRFAIKLGALYSHTDGRSFVRSVACAYVSVNTEQRFGFRRYFCCFLCVLFSLRIPRSHILY